MIYHFDIYQSAHKNKTKYNFAGVVPSDLIPLSPGGGAGTSRLNNSQHIKFLPTEPVPYSQLTSQTQLEESQIDSEEVMRIVAEQSSSHHQPLISLEPSPDFVLLEDVVRISLHPIS